MYLIFLNYRHMLILMENAEKIKKMAIRRWLFCGFGVQENIQDPRTQSQFMMDVMDPYGRQDKYLEKKFKENNDDD